MIKGKYHILIAFAIIAILIPVGVVLGATHVSMGAFWESISNYDPENNQHFAIWHLRAPRLFTAVMVGLLLSATGFLFQTISNNALADPYVLGTASGAALGANLSILGYVPVLIAGVYLSPLWAFLGALLVTLLVVKLSFFNHKLSKTTLILSGISISALSTSVSSILIFYSDSSDKIRSLIFWSMGSFDNTQWLTVFYLLALTVGLYILSVLFKSHISLYLLGFEQASLLKGKTTAWANVVVFGYLSLVVAIVVSQVGPIGFVGLIVPHIVRALKVKGLMNQIVLSGLYGGCFMLFCEVFSKIIYPPVGLPIGIVTSAIGVPYFIYLLRRTNYKFH